MTSMRPRRYVRPWVIAVATPLFRYSTSRDAYILRGVGQKRGPVLKLGEPPADVAPEPRFSRDDALTEQPRERTGR